MLLDLERAQAILRRAALDALLTCRPEHVTYVSGVADTLECRFDRDQRTYALLFPDAAPALVAPWFEVAYLQARSCVECVVADKVWRREPSPQDPSGALEGDAERAVADLLRERRRAGGSIGLDEHALPWPVYQRLRSLLPDAELVAATAVFEELRLIKTPEELRRLERAAQAVQHGYDALAARVKPGVTERELTIAARDAILAAGADEVFFTFVAAGARAGIDHVTGGDLAIGAGEVVKCDMGARVAGYCSDIGRSFACGEPSGAQAQLYQRMRETQERVLAAARPGMSGADLFGIYLEGMRGSYGDVPWHMIGHGIGLEVHEIPSLGPSEARRLEPNMVLCVEIGYLDPGRQGLHLEDMIVIEAAGCRRLIPPARGL